MYKNLNLHVLSCSFFASMHSSMVKLDVDPCNLYVPSAKLPLLNDVGSFPSPNRMISMERQDLIENQSIPSDCASSECII